jgi:signal transduction histidine kinase
MPASTEFTSLCQLQVALLVQTLGASQGGVYLTENWQEGTETELVPIVSYPDLEVTRQQSVRWLPFPNHAALAPTVPQLSSAVPLESHSGQSPSAIENLDVIVNSNDSLQPQQLALPLIHNSVVMGFLMTVREDRPWTAWEQRQIEKIAHTLEIACVLDQQNQWLIQQQSQPSYRLDSRQNELLDSLFHQLHSPLTALRTFGKLLLKRLLPPDPNREVAASIIHESEHLQDLLQQVDRILKEQSGPEALKLAGREPMPLLLTASGEDEALTLQPHDLAEILDPLLGSVVAIAQERQLHIHVDVPANLQPIQVSVKALREALNNILDNALKYTPAGGDIWVRGGYYDAAAIRFVPSAEIVAVTISDTGPGIPIQDYDHLFERRYRGVQAEGEILGSGLGLAIARDLLRKMHGDLQFFSPAISEFTGAMPRSTTTPGTTFIAWLPVYQG